MSQNKLIAILSGLIIILSAAGIYIYLTMPNSGTANPPATTASLIGGDFEMIDHNGKTVTQNTYKGNKKLIFFGFTNCPAVCPTELSNLTMALEQIDAKKAKQVTVLFVSIDPDYDTPELMKEYVEAFHDDFIGLSGSVAQVAKMTKAFRVYYAKVPDAESDIGYTMDHSAYTYLMDENNVYIKHLSPNSSVEEMVAFLKANL